MGVPRSLSVTQVGMEGPRRSERGITRNGDYFGPNWENNTPDTLTHTRADNANPTKEDMARAKQVKDALAQEREKNKKRKAPEPVAGAENGAGVAVASSAGSGSDPLSDVPLSRSLDCVHGHAALVAGADSTGKATAVVPPGQGAAENGAGVAVASSAGSGSDALSDVSAGPLSSSLDCVHGGRAFRETPKAFHRWLLKKAHLQKDYADAFRTLHRDSFNEATNEEILAQLSNSIGILPPFAWREIQRALTLSRQYASSGPEEAVHPESGESGYSAFAGNSGEYVGFNIRVRLGPWTQSPRPSHACPFQHPPAPPPWALRNETRHTPCRCLTVVHHTMWPVSLNNPRTNPRTLHGTCSRAALGARRRHWHAGPATGAIPNALTAAKSSRGWRHCPKPKATRRFIARTRSSSHRRKPARPWSCIGTTGNSVRARRRPQPPSTSGSGTHTPALRS